MPQARTQRMLLLSLALAVLVRCVALIFQPLDPQTGIDKGYFLTAAAVVSGHGLLMGVPAGPEDRSDSLLPDIVAHLKECEANGSRVSEDNPYPQVPDDWIPATVHPPAYSLLIAGLYELLNYRGTILTLHGLQIILDSIACLFAYSFVASLWNRRAALIAAFLYAFAPPYIFCCLSLLPDAFHGFLMGGILAATAAGVYRNPWWFVVAGASIAVACYLRAEYLLFPAALVPIVLFNTSLPLLKKILWSSTIPLTMVILLLPWALWTKSRTGVAIFSSTAGGANLYQSIGEDTENPWNIVSLNRWCDLDALERGFESSYSVDADRFYTRRFKEYVMTYPRRFAKLVIVHRLPYSLVPPYLSGHRSTASEFNFTHYRLNEGLSRWGVLKRYPGRVLKNMWPQFLMLAYSLILLISIIAAVLKRGQSWGYRLWIILPWLYFVATMSLLKQHEPRNLIPIVVVQIAALAVVIDSARFLKKNRVA